MKTVQYTEVKGWSTGYLAILGVLGAIIVVGLGAAYYMEHQGHWVTGMSNQVVWGMPHVFAIFLIVAASGALNVASIGTVFGKPMYKPLARLSGLLALALLAGGLAVLVLDLGRPDRLIVAMTKYNFRSIFAWNIFLYTGFMVIVAVYLWFMMEARMNRYYKTAGYAAFIWRLILTTGTGSIFGFLVARPGYDAAVMAPMFIVMSFSFGLAIFMLVLMASYKWLARPLGDAVLGRLKNLLGVFVAAALYFVAVQHLTNLYAAEHHAFEAFMLLDGGIYPLLFWGGFVVVGSILPMVLVWHPAFSASRTWLGVASALVILGGLTQIYVILIGGQAYPMEMLPGHEIISSAFFDGVVAGYSPSLPEFLLGMAGVGVALIMVVIGVKVLRFLPVTLADEAVDPHATAKA
ncbi:MAG: NrfD/PsrC family molybdoenzyme membrane anchor subunit [Gammaproteobacteria bacterium]|nr:NrfD/PsrC family molybdoenzyme membrane anchor subunit [Gammaproteobacteria bacterium]